MKDGEQLAAVDLGSNSFRLEISILHNGHLQRVEYLKETVRQGAGLDGDSRLNQDAMERGWQCLARFGERLHNFQPWQVRALATQTLREAQNRNQFLAKGRALLGHPIEVISGQEEARLIYAGVTYLLPRNIHEQRMVIDIGGRSTELVAGMGQTPLETVSFPFGSLSWSQRFFVDGRITAKGFNKAEIAASAIIEEHSARFAPYPREHVYGSSGSIGAVSLLLESFGSERNSISLKGVEQLRGLLIEAGHYDKLNFENLREDRKPVIAGGVAVLLALMRMLGIETLQTSDGALRQGAMLDLMQHDDAAMVRDIRHNSVASLCQRFGFDKEQGGRIARVAEAIWHALDPGDWRHSDLQLLKWTARLHEIGISIAYERFHHHGAYILRFGDCQGFLPSERDRMACLIEGHRGKLKKVAEQIEASRIFTRQLMCLRLAVALCNARKDPDMKSLDWTLNRQDGITVSVPQGWTQLYPQSYYLLQEEKEAWERVGLSIRIQVIEEDA